MIEQHRIISDVARAAYDYISKNDWTIVAVGKDKRPLGEWGVGGRNRYDYRNLEAVFDIDAPGIGIITGPSGIVIIDLDSAEAIRTWHETFGAPTTLVARTPRGRHLYFKAPPNTYIGPGTELLPGVDVRGGESYAVLPPSILHGEYAWASRHAIAELPANILDLIKEAKPKRKQAILEGGKFGSGQRNDMLASMAGSMRRSGFDHASISAALHETNKTRCEPPLPPEEVDGIAESISRYDEGTPDNLEEITRLRLRAATREPDEDPVLVERINFLDTRRLVNENPEPINWVWEDYLAPGTLNMLHGEGGLGKSFFALKLAEQILNREGGLVFDKKTRHGGVVILDGENAETQIHHRIHNTTISADARLHIASVSEPVLGYDEETHKLFDWISTRLEPLLVIIDSQRALWAGDEKEQAEAGTMLRRLAKNTEQYPYAILLLHHDNRGGDFAGSSDINAAISGARFHLTRTSKDDTTGRKLTMPKNRVGPEMPTKHFTLTIATLPSTLRHEISGISIEEGSSEILETARTLIPRVKMIIHNQPVTNEEIWSSLDWDHRDRKPIARKHRDTWNEIVDILSADGYEQVSGREIGLKDNDGRRRIWKRRDA